MRIIVTLALLLVLCNLACADIIKLIDNVEIKGKIVGETDKIIVVAISGGSPRKIQREDVAEIIREKDSEKAPAKPVIITDVPDSVKFAITSHKNRQILESPDPKKPPSDKITVSGVVWSPSAIVKVGIGGFNRKTDPIDAKVSPPAKPGGRATWSANITLFRGNNKIQAVAATGDGNQVEKTFVNVFLNPIFVEPLPSSTLKGTVPLIFFVRNPKEVVKSEIKIDGKTVANTNYYMWDTTKYENKPHDIQYYVEYAGGEDIIRDGHRLLTTKLRFLNVSRFCQVALQEAFYRDNGLFLCHCGKGCCKQTVGRV